VEGDHAAVSKAGDCARSDVVTCGLDASVGLVRDQVEDSPYPFALVTSGSGVLLGRLRASALSQCDPELRAEEVMEAGPSTVRPHKSAASVAETLARGELRWTIVTGADGRLIGVASREELERAADSKR
jgi:CBS domain-containing protein